MGILEVNLIIQLWPYNRGHVLGEGLLTYKVGPYQLQMELLLPL